MSLSAPRRHISIRVPWHDNGWNGTVCCGPKLNTACLKLKNIAENKNDEAEAKVAGESLKDLPEAAFPPCVTERATFMADFAFERTHTHPFSVYSDSHAHFEPTVLRYHAYSAAGVPFRWMMRPFVFGDPKEGTRGLVEDYPLEAVTEANEPDLRIKHWFHDHRNQRALFETFWAHVRPQESLVFFYAKEVPLVEDTGRRVIVGVGRVTKLGTNGEYRYTHGSEGKLRGLLWERMVSHSIRPDFQDGFLMPYQEALAKSEELGFDPADVVAFAPEDRFVEFSYATEHVGDDAAIDALLECRAALYRSRELFNVDTARQERWIDRELGRLWKERGAYPGMGAVLSASGVEMGHFVAHALSEAVGEEGNPWDAWDQALEDPKAHLPPDLARRLDATVVRDWQLKSLERRAFLELLSRIDVTAEQAAVLAIPEARREHGISESDADFVRNPYLFYEATRLSTVPVSIGAVDRGVFSTTFVRETYPLPEPSRIETAVDGRRLRALVVRELESAAARGDTLLPRDRVVTALRSRDENADDARADVTGDLLGVAEVDHFDGVVRVVEMASGDPAYQLERLAQVGEAIRRTVERRLGGTRHALETDWRAELDAVLGPESGEGEEAGVEARARTEKAAALEEVAAARLSVLIGPAGTGKTTLLSALCRHPEISQNGIVLLAPTGKARVRVESIARLAQTQNVQAYTLAQFLLKSGRFDGRTQRYVLTGEPGERVGRTVIVDECSMLTEEMLAALFESLSGVHRLILVGDPRQLPPIGAGRSFADIVARLEPDDVEARFPRVGPGYAELTVPRRQGAGVRDDLQLAAWFGGGALGPAEDEVFEILSGAKQSDTVRFVQWETPGELEAALPEVLAETLGFDPELEEWQSFAASLGGVVTDRGGVWFNNRWKDRRGAGEAAETWQILSPVRQRAWGVETLNRAIHRRYKDVQLEAARNPGRYRSIPKPMGDSQIVYGDKVINNRNTSVYSKRMYPEPDGRGYLANGEIGVVVGHRRTKKRNWKPDYLEIEFSTQPGTVFKYYPSDFSEEGTASIELAYALTIHKAQGSEFGTVLLILPRSPLMLSRELLYTALTRQLDNIVVFHQGSATELQKLSGERYSATATRNTNLFGPPNPVEVRAGTEPVFLEDRLIHRTARGEAVRSKSEVIIANLLHAKGLDYHYESPLERNGVTKYPDFTIEDDDTGVTYYWEHAGMMHDPGYRRRWASKQVWYRDHGILPLDQGGGPQGTLIFTEDQPTGGIDAAAINELVARVFGA